MKKRMLAVITAVLLSLSLASTASFAATTSDATGGTGTADDPYTSVEAYAKAYKDDADKLAGKDVYVTISGQMFTEGTFMLPNTQSMSNPPLLHLTITGCEFTGNTAGDTTNSSFMYLPNCKELVIDDCTFNADTGLKYGINWNLVNVTGATVKITNSTFSGAYEKNAIKVNQRNGADDVANDVKTEGYKAASVDSVVISGCTFSDTAKISIGSQGKGEGGAAAPSTGGFPVDISGNESAVSVVLDYAAAKSATPEAIELASGNGFVKTESVSAENRTVKYTSGGATTYYVGDAEDINEVVKNAKSGDSIEIIKGSADLDIPAAEVTVTNNGEGTVTVNDTAVTKGSPVTTEEAATTPEQPSDESNKPTDTDKPAAPQDPTKATASDAAPKTGDDFNMTLMAGIMAAAAAVAAGTVISSRRKKSH